MDSIAYYDGKIGPSEELTVPFNDRTHFFGDGVYDATLGAGGKALFLEDHLDRFYSSAALFHINVPLSRDELARVLLDLIAQVDGKFQFVYWQVSRGIAPRNHVYPHDMQGKILATVERTPLIEPDTRFSLITLEDKRFEYCNAKTLNLMPSVEYLEAAVDAGADEAVLHRNGTVTECAHSNVSILKNGILYSHPNDEHILRGIGKTHLIQAAYRTSVPVIERAFTVDEMMNADEIIVTTSSEPCIAAKSVDGQSVGGHDPETLSKLRDAAIQEILDYTGIDSFTNE